MTAFSPRIVYANTEFARLARCQGEVLHLMQVRHLPDYLARSLERHVEFVWRTGTEFSDQEDMLVEGKLVHLNVQCLPFAAEDGASGTVVVVYRDITAHVEAELRLATMLRQTVEAFTHAVEAVDPYLKLCRRTARPWQPSYTAPCRGRSQPSYRSPPSTTG